MSTIKNEKSTFGSTKESVKVEVEEKVNLNIIRLTPERTELILPVVMVTGLATIIDSFKNVVNFLAGKMPFLYVETREKISSQIEGATSFGIDKQSLDLAKIVDYFQLENNNYFLVGYSYGATIVAHSYSYLQNKPLGIILLEPTPVFHYPKWSINLIKLSGPKIYSILKPFAKWYLAHFFINKKEDNEMAVISSKSLDNADPVKLKAAILDIAGYEVWDRLEAIDCESLVIGTSKDGLHNKEEVERMVKMIKKSAYIDLETNQRTHSIELGEVAFRFFQKLAN